MRQGFATVSDVGERVGVVSRFVDAISVVSEAIVHRSNHANHFRSTIAPWGIYLLMAPGSLGSC